MSRRRAAVWYAAAMIAACGVLAIGRPTREPFVPQKNVKIVMFSTPNIVEQFSGLAADINSAYAKKHGYDFEHVIEDVHNPSDRASMVWKMVDVIEAALQSSKEYDAVFYIDSDAVFWDHHRNLDWLFEIQDGHIVGCTDSPNGPNYINTGTLFVRNTARARALIKTWSAMRGKPKYQSFPYEQGALEDLAKAEGFRGIISRPAEEFNSIKANVDAGHREGLFVLHMMATSPEKRTTEFLALKLKYASSGLGGQG